MRGHRKVEVLHHLDKGASVDLLQPRVIGQLLADGRVRTPLVFVCRKYLQLWIELQYSGEQTIVERCSVAAGQISAPSGSDEQRVTSEHAVRDVQTHGVARVARCMESLKSQPANHQQFPSLHSQIDEWCRAGVMHHHRHIELARELLSSGEMIRMCMGIDEIPEAQTILCGQRGVAVDLAELRVDQRRSTGLLTADDIGPAAAGRHCFKYHCCALRCLDPSTRPTSLYMAASRQISLSYNASRIVSGSE